MLENNSQYFDITNPDTIPIEPNSILLQYSSAISQSEIDSIEVNNTMDLRKVFPTGWRSYNIPSSSTWISYVQFLLTISDIQSIGFNYLLLYCIDPNDPFFVQGDQWYLPDIQLPDAWSITTGNPDLIVAILDNGTDWSNPDLGPDNGLGGASYPSGSQQWHGTMVSSVIAARTNNNLYSSGIAGGWNSDPVKIASYKVGDFQPDIEAVCDALLSGAEQGARLFNLSFGIPGVDCSGVSDPMLAMILYIKEEYDAILFCSSGNYGTTDVLWPACTDLVFGIGGTTHNGTKLNGPGYCNSNYGINLDISAPGEEILFPVPFTYHYSSTCGTSAATAVATGVGALLLSVNSCLSYDDMYTILTLTADRTGGYDYYYDPERPGHSLELGYGKINAYSALIMASEQLTEITTNTTFDSPKWFTHDLIVRSGSILTITSTVKFIENKKIVVEPGAQLIIDGGILTSTCPGFWGGIEVQGNRTLPQIPISNQGYVRISYPGMIENANPGIYSYDGGIVIASDATFRNNKRSVNISNYPGTNQSYLRRCLFEWTDIPGYMYGNPLFTGNQFFIGAEMVSPIKVQGCVF